MDLNGDLEKRIDSGFHLSSLPPAQGKKKGEEGVESSFLGYMRRVGDVDGMERVVESAIARYVSGGRQASPLVTQNREGSKIQAGGVLTENLAIKEEESGDCEKGEEGNDVPAGPQHSPSYHFPPVESRTA